jgi:hypothetical protein
MHGDADGSCTKNMAMILPKYNQKPGAARMRSLRGATLLFASFAGAACDGARAATCESLGLCDRPPKAPEHVAILCDRSTGSTCDRTTLDETVGLVVRRLADRPGSVLTVWMLGPDVATTIPVGEQSIPALKRAGESALAAHAAKVAKDVRGHLLAATTHGFNEPPTRKSPIAEGITKVAASDAGGLPRRIIILSDAREVGIWDFECLAVPTRAQFTFVLGRIRALPPGSLAGISIELAHVDGRPIPGRGCAVTLEREAKIRELWTHAFKSAGARHVRIASGPAVLPEIDEPSAAAREER